MVTKTEDILNNLQPKVEAFLEKEMAATAHPHLSERMMMCTWLFARALFLRLYKDSTNVDFEEFTHLVRVSLITGMNMYIGEQNGEFDVPTDDESKPN
jgi:hypothetical protein